MLQEFKSVPVDDVEESTGGFVTLFCVPRGGLNDTFNQIERARSFAEKHGLRLVVLSSLDPHSGEKVPLDSWLNLEESFDAFISKGTGEITESEVLAGPQIPLPSRRTRALAGHDVIYSAAGGGLASANLLQRLPFSKRILNIAADLIPALNSISCAVHIRNTDYKSDWKPAMLKLTERLDAGAEILVATDDTEVVTQLRAAVPQIQFRVLTDLPNYPSDLNSRQAAILELLLISSRDRLIAFKLTSGKGKSTPSYSGYSRLAMVLWLFSSIHSIGVWKTLCRRSTISAVAGDLRRPLAWLAICYWLFRLRRQLISPTGAYEQLAVIRRMAR